MNVSYHTARASIVRRSSVLLTGFLLLIAAGCHDDDGTGPAPTGTVAGTISSSLGGPLEGVEVTVAPTSGTAPGAVTTGADGKFSVSGVAVADGKGTISLAGLPDNCTDPGDIAYTGLANGVTMTKDIEVTCEPPLGTVTGVVTSSLGGPLADVTVSLDPDGDAAAVTDTTAADGSYTFASVPVGAGSVSLTDGIPDNCSAPSAASYEGLEDDSTKTVNFEVTCEPTTGALTVKVIGLVDLDAAITVTGPNSFDTTLTATSTLTDLEPGSYTVTADTLVIDDPVVVSRYLAIVEQSVDTVTAGDTVTATVTYAIRTGSGGLWFTNTGSKTISRFAAAQLHASGNPADTTGITTANGALFAAFDSSGNFWASSATSNDLVAFTRDQLVAGGTPTPTLTLSSTALQDPRGIAFDANRNLWVANSANGTLIEFSASQVEDGGSATPYLSITTTGLSHPTAIAFDTAGNLWVTDNQASQVVKFTPAQLAVAGAHAPTVVLGAASGSLDHPTALAFDAADNLWVANAPAAATAQSVVSFAPTDRAATGNPEPGTTIILDDGSSPYGLAFDESGSLWVALNAADALVKFTADQLSTGGALTPDVTITAGAGGSLDGPSALIFDPHAEGLPISW